MQWRRQLQEIGERTLTSLRDAATKKSKSGITLEALTEAYDNVAAAHLHFHQKIGVEWLEFL